MPLNIEYFSVKKLHGRLDYTIQFDSNKLVMVGENGTGKSTISTMLFYFLARQWHRLSEFRFESIATTINGRLLELPKEALEESMPEPTSHRLGMMLGLDKYRFAVWEINTEIAKIFPEKISGAQKDNLATTLSNKFKVPRVYFQEMVNDLAESSYRSPIVAEISKYISSVFDGTVLFLPTYRRIEKELEFIYPGVEKKLAESPLLTQTSGNPGVYIELVQFGMDDVQSMSDKSLSELKDNLRQGLSSLTGKYLSELIQGQYKKVDKQSLMEIDAGKIFRVLGRIDEKTLSNGDKTALSKQLLKIQKKKGLNENDKAVAHFFSKLSTLSENQAELETDIRTFIALCGTYLEGKTFFFNQSTFSLYILKTVKSRDSSKTKSYELLDLKDLSSGEKQVISLFAHLLLSRQRKFFVIIDEPELSLSVIWQKKLLPDILASGRCEGLLAVTHSPYIFENEFDKYTHAIEEFVC